MCDILRKLTVDSGLKNKDALVDTAVLIKRKGDGIKQQFENFPDICNRQCFLFVLWVKGLYQKQDGRGNYAG